MMRFSLTAVILAFGVSVTIIILALDEYTHPGHLTVEEGNTISTILGAAIGALATYLGSRAINHGEGPET